MSAPEQIASSHPDYLETGIPDVTIRILLEHDLPELKAFMEKNAMSFIRQDIVAMGLYDMIEEEITTGEHTDTRHRMGVWHKDELIGYAGVTPADNLGVENEVEICRMLDPEYTGKGIGTAVLAALVNQQSALGKVITAETLPRNKASLRSLGKMGFKLAGRNENQRTVLRYDPDHK